MRSRFKLLGHPAHPIMVVFPLAFYPLAAIAEVIYFVLILVGWHNADKILTFDTAFFWRAGFLMLVVGWLGQMAASLPGLIDWLNIPNTAPAKDKATFHLGCLLSREQAAVAGFRGAGGAAGAGRSGISKLGQIL